MPQNSNFWLPRGHRFFPQNGSYSYGAKSRWGPSRVHLGSNGVPLGKKNGSKPSKITMPQNSNFRLPRGHRFFPKLEATVMAPNHGGYPLGSILGPVGSLWVKKMGQNRRKLPCPKIRIFVIDFSQKMEVTVIAPNQGGDTIESILGPVGSHWVKKMGQNRQKLPCPKIRIFDYPAVIFFCKKWKSRLWRQITVGTP